MKNIVLIGMSGIGKTTIGEYISYKLKKDFIDTDNLISNNMKLYIEDIFLKFGEEHFRNLEREIVKKISSKEDLVISTGGGIILNHRNILDLKKKGIVFLLDGSIDTIVNNINKSSIIRPLLKSNSNLYEKTTSLYNERKNLYFSSADSIILVDNKSVEEIGDEIIKIFNKLMSCGKL